MLHFVYKKRGAISIFLIIVLVPMLAFASIFVDLSRVQLAQAVVKSSGELTLNTALTDYDAVLKDMYGLFATAQDVDQLFESLEQYYRDCMKGAGVAEVDANDYVGAAMSLLKSEAGEDDLLNLSLSKFEMESPTGGNLANPAILKNQIVEFMKFRAPIDMGMGLIEGLNGMKDMKKQAKLVDDKNDFYKKHSSMLEDLEYVWSNLQDYMYRDSFPERVYGRGWGKSAAFPGGDYLASLEKSLGFYNHFGNDGWPLYETGKYTVRYLYYADDFYLPQFSGTQKYCVKVEDGKNSDNFKKKWTVITNDARPYTVLKNPSAVSLDALKETLYNVFLSLEMASKTNDLYKDIIDYSICSDSERIRQVSMFNQSITRTPLSTSSHAYWIDYMVKYLVELQNCFDGFEDKDSLKHIYVRVDTDENGHYSLTYFNEGDSGQPTLTLESCINTQLAHLDLNDTDIANYNIACDSVVTYYTSALPAVEAAKDYVKTVMTGARDMAESAYSFVDEKRTKLNNAISKLGTIKATLENPESEYNKALAKWRGSAQDNSDYSMGQNDMAEIERLEKILTIEKVNKLITRLNGAKGSLDSICNGIDQYTYLGKKWREFGDGKDINWDVVINMLSDEQKQKIESHANNEREGDGTSEHIPPKSGVEVRYDWRFDQDMADIGATIKTGTMKVKWEASEAAVSPDLTQAQDALYTWLYSNFFDTAKVEQMFGTKFRDLFNIGEDGTVTLTRKYSKDSQSSSSTEEVKAGKDDAEDTKKQFESSAETQNTKTNGASTAKTPDYRFFLPENVPSGEWSEALQLVKEANAGISSDSEKMLDSSNSLDMFDKLIELVADMGTDLRDDMYITDYITSMFSYATYEAELTVKFEKDPTAYKGSWYEADGNKFKYSSNFNTLSKKTDIAEAAQTLTLVPINPNNNYLYGKEVEYILYGINDPVAKTFATIYLIRFALNTIYAFTDAEINSMTTAAATALFGCPPLTPLIPIAKIAFTIGISLAESAYDLYILKTGSSVPLIKNSKTWVMKPSGLGKKAASVVANEVADKVLDQGEKLLNDIMDMTDEELQKLIDGGEKELEKLAHATTESIKSEISNYGNKVIEKAMGICTDINNELMEQMNYQPGSSQEKIDMAIQKLDEWMGQQPGDSSDIIYTIKKAAVDYLKADNGKMFGELFDCIGVRTEIQSDGSAKMLDGEDLYGKMNGLLSDFQTGIDDKVSSLINEGGNAISKLKDDTIAELKQAANEGAESLRKSVKGKIKDTFGSTGDGDISSGSVVASLLSWTYSDYLKIFLMVGMVTAPDTILLRTADVIELNMCIAKEQLPIVFGDEQSALAKLAHMKVNPNAYKLSKSYTYLRIKATVNVEPLLLSLPLFDDITKDDLTGTTWHEVEFVGTLGY